MPVIQTLAEEFGDRVRFAKVHVDRGGEILSAFRASGVPTYILFRDGREIDRLSSSFISWFLEVRLRRMVQRVLR